MSDFKSRISKLEEAVKLNPNSSLPLVEQMQAIFPKPGEHRCADLPAAKAERLEHLHELFGPFDDREVHWMVVEYLSAQDGKRIDDEGGQFDD